ncbi:MAG TPA: hypothetical protein VIC58_02100 [Actinomycetota bacterium]|jgi:hypothetical protein
MGAEEAVDQLATMLQDPTYRRQFVKNPDEALGQIADAELIPEELVSSLRGMQLGELGFVARVNNELRNLKGNPVIIQMPL